LKTKSFLEYTPLPLPCQRRRKTAPSLYKSVKEYPGTGKEANFNSVLEKILTDLSKNRGANSLIFYKFRFVGTI
jgi:hypothetical protein